ncbi:MAG: hypothetical protein K2W80_13800, partial [Burkholderiales bacterium]|nr:hypothetical protein [Burkholderiales bacterium]
MGARSARTGRSRAGAARTGCSPAGPAGGFHREETILNKPHEVFELLGRIHSPADLRALERRELPQLCNELREFLLQSVARTGGHLSSNLGTVELTVALHYVFNTPADRLIWDV